jgi:hypothetical protein
VRRALSQNPNMLRTIIGLGLTLVLILSYAVYSATLDSAFYLSKTTNNEKSVDIVSDPNNGTYTFETNTAITWLNISIDNSPIDTTLEVSSLGGVWWHHPDLGNSNGEKPFQCFTPDTSDYEGLVEYCSRSSSHSIIVDSQNVDFRGLLSNELPLSGSWAFVADNQTEANDIANETVNNSILSRTWTVKMIDENEDIVNTSGMGITVSIVEHDIIDVSPYRIDPVTEMIWGMTALIGCFGIVLILPISLYIAASIKTKKASESINTENDED